MSLPKLATARQLAETYGLSERNVSSRLTKECNKMTEWELSFFREELDEVDGPYPKYMYYTDKAAPILDMMRTNADRKRNTR